jgi:phage replication initiation protein
MTRPSRNSLVLDGGEVKWRLQAERLAAKTKVHVDWVRFTVQRRNAAIPSADLLFGPEPFNIWEAAAHRVHKVLAELPDVDHWAGTQAMQLAQNVAKTLGESFAVNAEIRKGHDFYRYRWSIERNGQECGWVGFLTSSESPRQQAQGQTLHVNLFGAACTFADNGWNLRLAQLIDVEQGDVTRVDLALDFFDGMPGGMERLAVDYRGGAMDVYGKRPKTTQHGDWINGQERSFYLGKKATGKETNVYEKGHQLFGAESCNPWVRIETRYGNKVRVLPSDMLRRPADFFAGASTWHTEMLALADQMAEAEPVKTTPRLAIETVNAEVTRTRRWLANVAAPAVSFAMKYFSDAEIWDLFGYGVDVDRKLPGRLQGFSSGELAGAATRTVAKFLLPAGVGHAMQAA